MVSTPLPSLSQLGTDQVRAASTPVKFVEAVRSAAATARTPTLVEERRLVAARNSWTSRAVRLMEMMEQTGSGLRH